MSTHTRTTRGALRKSDLKQANERFVLNIVRQTPQISRSDIVRMTGLSPSSVTFIVNRMIRDGLLREVKAASTGRRVMGRQPVALGLRPDALIVIGVQVAQSQAQVVSANAHGDILAKRTITPHADHRVLLARTREAISGLIGRHAGQRLLGVGVSLVGTIDRTTGKVIADENQGWFDIEAGRILSEGIPATFYFENNAKLGALAERWFSKPGGKPLNNFVFVMTQGGLGTGVIAGGMLLQGANGRASEFGHTTLYPDGRRCVCGGIGCWEEYVSQRALERRYAERINGPSRRPKANAGQIVKRARDGDRAALETLREVAVDLGIGFANLNSAVDPEAIIVADYFAAGWDLLQEHVWESLRSRAPSRYIDRLRILPAQHGTDYALKGALALTLSHFFAQPAAAH